MASTANATVYNEDWTQTIEGAVVSWYEIPPTGDPVATGPATQSNGKTSKNISAGIRVTKVVYSGQTYSQNNGTDYPEGGENSVYISLPVSS